MSDRKQLMRQISEICFVIDDLTLYLDTHPLDGNALDEFEQAYAKRKELLCTYGKEYEPLTMNCIHVGQEAQADGRAAQPGVLSGRKAQPNDQSGQCTNYAGKRHWTWTDGPLPWEGGIV